MEEEEIREIFHDLKNDLATMTAMVNLHKIYTKTIPAEQLLACLQNRQMVISTAYEKLYHGGDYRYVNVMELIYDILSRLQRVCSNRHPGVKIEKEIDNIRIPFKTALPIAQIISEMVTNSYFHAFDYTKGGGLISFKLHFEDEKIILDYKDNGRGLESDYDPAGSQTLGMQFIISLAKQLGTRMEFPDDLEGFHAHMEINKPDRKA